MTQDTQQIEQGQDEQSQRKVAGFDKAIVTYHKIVAEAATGVVISKRKEEFVAYVKRVVFNDTDETVVNLPDLHTQHQIVGRMKELKG